MSMPCFPKKPEEDLAVYKSHLSSPYLCTSPRDDSDGKSPSRKASKTCGSDKESPTIIVGLFFTLGEAFASRKRVIKSCTKWAFNYCLLRRKQTED